MSGLAGEAPSSSEGEDQQPKDEGSSIPDQDEQSGSNDDFGYVVDDNAPDPGGRTSDEGDSAEDEDHEDESSTSS